MPDMRHRIEIAAKPARIFAALTTARGLSAWWTSDTEAQPRAGSIASFGFDRGELVLKMKVARLRSGKSVVWRCLGGLPEWKGTRVTWTLTRDGAGTALNFRQAGWPRTSRMYCVCNTTWGHLLYRLKQYVETGRRQPLFRD